MRRMLAVIIIAVFPAHVLFAGDNDESKEFLYSQLMVKNAIVPGLGMHMLGNEKEARLYFAALPMQLAGAGLVAAGVFLDENGIEMSLERQNNVTTLLTYKKELTSASRLLMLSGTGFYLYGNLLAAYSSYAVHSDFISRFGAPKDFSGSDRERIPLIRALTAPFRTDNIVSIDVLPIIGLSTLTGFSIDDYRKIGTFFRRDKVDFLGYSVSPATGFGLEILLACGIVTANAAWEELAFRGVALQTSGILTSSLSFGFAHLTNMLAPGTSVENTLLQTLFATAFGFYAADRVQQNENGLERMIALHFWNNLLAFVLGYMADPEGDQLFKITLSF